MQSIKANLIKCERALSPTGMSTIAPYVINPYRGCEFGCRYCYSQKNKVFQKQKRIWGEFVDVKINSLEILEKELKAIQPEKVLLGSTTEVYQPAEEKYLLTRNIIKLLNKLSIPITILTKSNLITRDIDILHNAKICFTINLHTDELIKTFELRSPASKERINTIKKLRDAGVDVYIHVGPILPGYSDVEKIMEMVYGLTKRVNFESLNHWMCPDQIIFEEDVFNNEDGYNKYWSALKSKILELNKKYNYRISFFFQPYREYWPGNHMDNTIRISA